ncbi:Mite allergen Der f 3 [Phytophthora nicotianae]|uniref:Mite allergen Der f 3 n=1 Tax=Phytophthora nicotianae TaxID=4792 RepID=A0A0W8CLP6_PHYNI|nr:Mite allergen Der f 3 [Phytophthora nicotianae]
MKVFSAALFASVTLTCVTCEATTHDERKLIAGGEIVPAGTKTYNVGWRQLLRRHSHLTNACADFARVFNKTNFPYKLRWVSVGSHDNGGEEDGEQIKVKFVTNHPEFDSNTQQYELTVLELATASSFKPVKLAKADGSDFKGGEWATSMGWGVTKDEGFAPPSVELLRVDLQIWTDKKCFEKYSVGDTTFCAGGLKNAGICGIDNGGPLIIESETTDESGDVLVGVAMGADGCGIEGNPGGFARVSSARDWLDDIISGESTD